MKILAISHSCVIDVNQQLYVALSRMPQIQVELVIPAIWQNEYTGDAQPAHLLPAIDFPVHCLPVQKKGHSSLYFYQSQLARVLGDAHPDVVFIDEEPWSLALAQAAYLCRRMNIPYVCYTKQNLCKSYPPPFSWLEKQTYRTAAAIVALSEEVRSVLKQKGFKGKCPLLAHACDLSLFTPQPAEELRQKHGLKGIVIGYMGRLVPEKGLDTLIEAAQILRRQPKTEEFTVFLVGTGAQQKSLHSAALLAGLQEIVVFAGAVPHHQAGEYMNAMDIFVLPSRTTPRWKEQFGRVVIEAMACEVPVIGSDSGEIPFLVRATGGGLVFKEGNAQDLSRRLQELITDAPKRRQLGHTGCEAVRRSYTYEAIAEELVCILQQAADLVDDPPSC